ncbi:uncharacterized protein LOC132741852 [Ruditapes philippinarum]|uniref:uncharacterized protein LOC132741852 n=1 Tax=Ruditapes philippinarum TaxID=129788 RepID=UPI00295C376C|nr:uncharacterized protein LOC132741852 [Ruditapes philippinarum]
MAGRFQFVSKDYIDFRVRDRIPKNTQRNTNWGVNTWNLWVTVRNNARQLGQPKFPCAMELEFISPQEMNEYLCHFVLEVRNTNGELYPATTLNQLLAGLSRYLKDELNRPDLNLYNPNNVYFNRFRQTLDAQMKLVTEKGIGTVKRQAQPITEEQEKCLWDKGLLSINDAVGLSKVVYFYNCKVFGLRSCDEHNNLQAEQYTFSSDEAGNFVLYHGRA